ncbi:MAG: GNAT family N-acetyltransferase [Paracoccaceae bacterium]|nr:GNAT family N-acetyltransferase [Paracoccaceae bacterium]
MTGRAFLETARLVLRPLAVVDRAACVAALNDLAITRWLAAVPHPYNPADFDGFLPMQPPGRRWAITQGGVFAGVIALDPHFGYWLVPGAQGLGVATEAGRAVLAAHFADPQAGDLVSGYLAGNVASANVLGKLGFMLTGQSKVHVRALDAEVTHLDMVLTRAAWAAVNPLVIDTPRLRLDPLTQEDAETFRALVTTPDIGRMLFIFPPDYSHDAACAMMGQNRWAGTRPLRLAIRQGGRMIGTIGLGAGDLPDIYYFLAPDCAGQGLMREAITAFCPAVRRHFGLAGLGAKVFTDNPASAHLLETCGFVRIGEDRVHSAQRAAPHPVWIYRQG